MAFVVSFMVSLSRRQYPALQYLILLDLGLDIGLYIAFEGLEIDCIFTWSCVCLRQRGSRVLFQGEDHYCTD